jgi:hypothetical protein
MQISVNALPASEAARRVIVPGLRPGSAGKAAGGALLYWGMQESGEVFPTEVSVQRRFPV